MDPVAFFIVAAFCLVAGFVDAVAGGGGLVSLPGYYIAGFQAHEAIGTNKINSLLEAFTAMVSFARLGYIPWRLALPCALAGLIGSFGGSSLALAIPSAAFTIILVVLIPLTAVYLFRSKTFSEESPSSAVACKQFPQRLSVRVLAVSLIVGVYDGFYGPGAGTFLLVLYTGFAGLTLTVANGVSKVVFCATNLAGMIVFFFGGKALLLLGLIAGVAGIIGSALGAWAFSKGGIKLAKPLILVVLAIFFVRVITELVAAL